LFLKFFDICLNNPGIWSQKFAAEVTKLWTPDEIRRFDGIAGLLCTDPQDNYSIAHFCQSCKNSKPMRDFSLVSLACSFVPGLVNWICNSRYFFEEWSSARFIKTKIIQCPMPQSCSLKTTPDYVAVLHILNNYFFTFYTNCYKILA